jgi:hypothetical protein
LLLLKFLPLQIKKSILFQDLLFFLKWFLQNIWTLVGVLFVLLSAGWLAKYLYASHLLTPQRVLLSGNFLFLACYAYGIYLAPHRWALAQVFLILGASGLALLLVLDHLFFHQLSANFHLVGLFLDVAVTTAIGIYYNSEGLAVSALGFAILIPFILNIPFNKNLFFLVYILCIGCHAILLLFLKDWRRPFGLAWLGALSYSLAFLPIPFAQSDAFTYVISVFFPLVFFILYSLTIFLFSLKTKAEKNGLISLLILTNLLFLGWIQVYHPSFKGYLFLLGTAVNAAFGYRLAQASLQNKKESLLGVVIGFFLLLFLAEATNELSWFTRYALYFLEGLAAVWFSLNYLNSLTTARYTAFYFFIPLLGFLPHLVFYLTQYPFFETSALLLIGLGALGTSAYLFMRANEKIERFSFTLAVHIIGIVSLLLALLWLVSFNLLSFDYQARGLALVLTALVGVILFIQGTHLQINLFSRLGGFILGCVVVWLLAVESARMSMPSRILTFFVVGIILLTTVNRHRFIKQPIIKTS